MMSFDDPEFTADLAERLAFDLGAILDQCVETAAEPSQAHDLRAVEIRTNEEKAA